MTLEARSFDQAAPLREVTAGHWAAI